MIFIIEHTFCLCLFLQAPSPQLETQSPENDHDVIFGTFSLPSPHLSTVIEDVIPCGGAGLRSPIVGPGAAPFLQHSHWCRGDIGDQWRRP